MCLLALAWKTHTDCPLVLVANRDELHSRPSAALAWWPDRAILGGRDLQSGGTWLAMDAQGRFGVITNLRGAPIPAQAPSRGELIPRFLESGLSPSHFLKTLTPEVSRYAGFNLLVGDRHEALVLSSAQPEQAHQLSSGVYAVSNNTLDADWPKVRRARAALSAALTKADTSTHAFLATLADRTEADTPDAPTTGLSTSHEHKLSSAFIVDDTYGTRCTTVIRRTGRVIEVVEQSYSAGGHTTELRMEKVHL